MPVDWKEVRHLVAELDKLPWSPKSEHKRKTVKERERTTSWGQLVEVGDYVVALHTAPYTIPGAGRGRTGTVFIVTGFTDFNWAILSNGYHAHCQHLLHV